MRLNLGTHLVVFVALVINLWVGGDLIEAWLGGPARQIFEITLILGYLWFVLGITAPLPWHRPAEDGREDDRRS